MAEETRFLILPTFSIDTLRKKKLLKDLYKMHNSIIEKIDQDKMSSNSMELESCKSCKR